MERVLSIFVVTQFLGYSFGSLQSSHWKNVVPLDGYIATNGTFKTASSLERCCLNCHKVQTCASVFYMADEPVSNCQIHDQAFNQTMGLLNTGSTEYYVIAGLDYCDFLYQRGAPISIIYNIELANEVKFPVKCDMSPDTGGWIVIQERTSPSDFYKTWEEYKEGFGDLNGNFWLGNEKIWSLTKDGNWKLRVELTYEDESGYAEYGSFFIGDEAAKYYLYVDEYNGTIGDSLLYHKGRRFSTHDRDNDIADEENCAQSGRGAWWYGQCHHSNLNGEFGLDMVWFHWKGHDVVSTSKMMIKLV